MYPSHGAGDRDAQRFLLLQWLFLRWSLRAWSMPLSLPHLPFLLCLLSALWTRISLIRLEMRHFVILRIENRVI